MTTATTILASLPKPASSSRLMFALRAGLWIALGMLVVSNVFMAALNGAAMLLGSDARDFATYREAAMRYDAGTLYGTDLWWYGWRYSPLAVGPLSVLTAVGEGAWRALHLVALLFLPGWRKWVVLASYPFWFDVHTGNFLVFVLVAAYWALRGNRYGVLATFLIALLIPRPLMIPIVLWVLWRQPSWRAPFLVLFIVHAFGVVATGYGEDWIRRLTEVGGEEVALSINAAPSALIGLWWMAAAIPLAVVAFRAGLPAASGLLLQPYWLPYYLLVLLADETIPVVTRTFRLRPFWRKRAPLASPRPAEDPVRAGEQREGVPG